MPRRSQQGFDEVAGVIGEEAALRLSLTFRGQRIYILRAYTDLHPLVMAIGREATELMVEHFAGLNLDIPSTPGLKAEVYRLADAGILTRDEIAAQLYIHRRQVYRWLREREDARANGSQFDLFAA